MSKLLSNKVYLSYLPDNKVAVSFIVNDKYTANLFVRELEHLDKIEVSAKQHKESRSLNQNKCMWAIISKISDTLNHEHTEESVTKIYGEMLVRANVKREYIAVLPEAIESLKLTARAIIPTGATIVSTNEKNGKQSKLVCAWYYFGSSTFNTKEMGELLEVVIAYASELGIMDSEIESIRSEYGL